MLFAHKWKTNTQRLKLYQCCKIQILFMNNRRWTRRRWKSINFCDDWREKKNDWGNKMWLSFEKADLTRVYFFPSLIDPHFVMRRFKMSAEISPFPHIFCVFTCHSHTFNDGRLWHHLVTGCQAAKKNNECSTFLFTAWDVW